MKIILAVIFAILIINLPPSVQAQEAIAVTNSDLVGIALPANAQRIAPASVPAEISGTLAKIVAAGNGKATQGDSEVLAWVGGNYNKAKAANIVNRLRGNLQASGWLYEVGGEENGVTVFSVLKDGAQRRAIVGFYAVTDEALLLAWTEILVANNNSGTAANSSGASSSSPTNTASTGTNDLIGTWDNGYSSILAQRQNTVTGALTPGRSSYFSYKFNTDGTFQFLGKMQTTNYSCTTTLFNDKAGRYRLDGATITLTPTKNYWKNTNCTPSNTTEKNHTLAAETYQWRIKNDEYGKRFVCLSNQAGETCYRFKED